MAANVKVIKSVDMLSRLLAERGLHVDNIILFGSQARQDSRNESDVDVVVVSRDFEGKNIFGRQELISGVHPKLVRKIDLPVDILLYSLSEWENHETLLSDLLHEEGLVVK